MTLTLTVPETDAAEFAALPDDVRREVRAYLRAAREVFTNDKGVCDRMKKQALILGVDAKTVQRKLYSYRQSSDWRVFVNKSKCPTGSLPNEFIEFWKSLCERNQRKCRPAYRELLRRWRSRKPIPGYPEPGPHAPSPLPNGSGIPHGWSYRNLMNFQPTRFELTAARIGRTAAAAHRELVFTTRKGLWVGSHYMIDDMWHDHFVNSFIERQAGRPLELFSHDLYSARKVRWGIRVRTRKDDGKAYHGLTKEMTRYILAATLFLDGYSRRGTVMVVEYGAAGIDDDLAEILQTDSGGLITISESGMTGAIAHAGQYPGISRGNFRHKASLESSNNLTHNEFADLPGQTGKDVSNRPEQLDALLDHNFALLAARESLSPERAALLSYPILELNDFMTVAAEKYRNIENYTEHDLNDWIECGHVVNEVCIGGFWIDQCKLTPEQSAKVVEMIDAGLVETRVRKMSRREVWDIGAIDLVKLPGFGVCHILGQDLARERKIVDGRFEFEDKEVGPGLHRYARIAVDPRNQEVHLREGEIYSVFVNPFAPETLFACDAKGGYIGECRRIDKPCRADTDAVHRRCGEVAKRENDLLQPLRLRHLADAREKADRHARNAAVLGDKALTIRERIHAEHDKLAVQSPAEFLPNPEEAGPERPSSDGPLPATDFL